MHATDEFLWGGLRTRLERMGRVRPRASTERATSQPPEKAHGQMRFRALGPALRPRVAAAGVAHLPRQVHET
jgi:hypothetical protein